jgi:peptidoglycan/LPS O-acetylase OafA/YrhL
MAISIAWETAVTSSTVTNVTKSRRLDYIDGLRGIAVSLVLLRHFYMDAYEHRLPRWADPMGLGYLGVHLFLLLSGFCIAWAYVGPRPRPFQWGDFVGRRAKRILPAYYVVLGALLLFSAFPMHQQIWQGVTHLSLREEIWQAVTHLTMTHNLFPGTALTLNGAFWSLALECQLYVVFPFLLLAYRKHGMALVIAAVFVIQTAFRVYVLRYGTQYNDLTFVLPWSVAGRVLDFALGMGIATLVAKQSHDTVRPVWLRGCALATPILFGLALVLKSRLGVTHPLTDLAWTLGFVGILLAASDPGGKMVHAALSWRPLVGLGVISYSVYLIHKVVQEPLTRFLFAHLKMTGTHAMLLLPVVLAITLPICALFYYLVEKPAMTYFGRKRSTGTEAPVLSAKPVLAEQPTHQEA